MLSLKDLTVADVSGMIAAGITLIHIFLPFALPLILLRYLQERDSTVTTSATTWSVVGGYLHSSRWPMFLRADSAAVRGVPKRIVFLIKMGLFLSLLTAIAPIVTPLGLYQSIVLDHSPTLSSFHYIEDTSPFGYGTPPRIALPWSRFCGALFLVECPNSFSNVTDFGNGTYIVYNYDTTVPNYVIGVFESGLAKMSPSVSSIFDIQTRSYTWSLIDDYNGSIPLDNGSAYPVTDYRQIGTLIMDQKVDFVEGLIVDMERAGIGFRNHSAASLLAITRNATKNLGNTMQTYSRLSF